MNDISTTRASAEARFAKIQRQAAEGAEAISDQKAEDIRVRENMARLKALREAREAAEAERRLPAKKPSTKRGARLTLA